jgi:hypothetical protein
MGLAAAVVVVVVLGWGDGVCLGDGAEVGLVVNLVSARMICISQRQVFSMRYSCSPWLKQATFLGPYRYPFDGWLLSQTAGRGEGVYTIIALVVRWWHRSVSTVVCLSV